MAKDSRVRIVNGETIGTEDKASASNWPQSDAYATYGSNTDLWGETWTVAQINSSGFGVVLSAIGVGSGTAFVDHIRITVYYS